MNPAAQPTISSSLDADVLVVGGGLAGLTAAAFAARSGADVILLERSDSVGGRASTHDENGFRFNVGPHALYNDGAAARALGELSVSFTGRRPPASGGLAFDGGSLHALPGGFVSLVTTDLLSPLAKLELARVLGSLGKLDAKSLEGRTLRQWLDSTFRDVVVRRLVQALMRLTAYANDPERSCAAASLTQLQHGLARGVLYVDGGWATLTEGLRRAAERDGVRVRTGQRVRRVRRHGDHAEVVVVASGSGGEERTLRVRTVVLALPPGVAAAMVEGEGEETLGAWAEGCTPVKAACLDLGLRRLPDPRRLFVLGIDRPLYFSVHSASARLAPGDGALVHVAKYLGPDAADPKAVEAELEAFCDLVQPGWRSEVAERRYLPSMMVTGALVEAGRVRPGPEVPGSAWLLVAGDWVGDEAMIADAAMASGRKAGLLAGARRAAQGPGAGGSDARDGASSRAA